MGTNMTPKLFGLNLRQAHESFKTIQTSSSIALTTMNIKFGNAARARLSLVSMLAPCSCLLFYAADALDEAQTAKLTRTPTSAPRCKTC